MRNRYAAKPLLFSVAALALSACSDPRQEPAPKTAATTEVTSASDAIARFSEGIDWKSRPEARAALHRDLLDRGDAVGELLQDVVHRSSEFEWFAVVDYEPGAYFRHPVAYAFLTYSQPRVSLLQRAHLPTINSAPVWPDVGAFLRESQLVYSNSWLDRPPARSLIDLENLTPEDWPSRMAVDQCKNQKRAYAVLMHNLENLDTSRETVENLEMMAAALQANGYNVIEFASDQSSREKSPYLNLAAAKGGGIYQLKNFVASHYDFNDCCEEIFFYLTGETTLQSEGIRSRTSFELPFAYAGESNARKPARWFYAEDLVHILAPIKTCHLNIAIDANNADGFADDLLLDPSVESVLTSCRENEYTYSSSVDSLAGGSFIDPFSTADGERGSEFTSSLAKAIYDKSKERTDRDPPTAASQLAQASFEAVKKFDLAYLGGKSEPRLRGRVLNSNCPCGIDDGRPKY